MATERNLGAVLLPNYYVAPLDCRAPAGSLGDAGLGGRYTAAADHMHPGLGLRIPLAHSPVGAQREQATSTSCEFHSRHGVRVTAEDEERLSGRGVPDAGRAVSARRGHEVAAGVERDPGDVARVPDEG